MDKVRQIDKEEIKEITLVDLARKYDNLYFIGLGVDSEYYIKPVADCKLEEIYGLLKDDRPLIEIYGGR